MEEGGEEPEEPLELAPRYPSRAESPHAVDSLARRGRSRTRGKRGGGSRSRSTSASSRGSRREEDENGRPMPWEAGWGSSFWRGNVWVRQYKPDPKVKSGEKEKPRTSERESGTDGSVEVREGETRGADQQRSLPPRPSSFSLREVEAMQHLRRPADRDPLSLIPSPLQEEVQEHRRRENERARKALALLRAPTQGFQPRRAVAPPPPPHTATRAHRSSSSIHPSSQPEIIYLGRSFEEEVVETVEVDRSLGPRSRSARRGKRTGKRKMSKAGRAVSRSRSRTPSRIVVAPSKRRGSTHSASGPAKRNITTTRSSARRRGASPSPSRSRPKEGKKVERSHTGSGQGKKKTALSTNGSAGRKILQSQPVTPYISTDLPLHLPDPELEAGKGPGGPESFLDWAGRRTGREGGAVGVLAEALQSPAFRYLSSAIHSEGGEAAKKEEAEVLTSPYHSPSRSRSSRLAQSDLAASFSSTSQQLPRRGERTERAKVDEETAMLQRFMLKEPPRNAKAFLSPPPPKRETLGMQHSSGFSADITSGAPRATQSRPQHKPSPTVQPLPQEESTASKAKRKPRKDNPWI